MLASLKYGRGHSLPEILSMRAHQSLQQVVISFLKQKAYLLLFFRTKRHKLS